MRRTTWVRNTRGDLHGFRCATDIERARVDGGILMTLVKVEARRQGGAHVEATGRYPIGAASSTEAESASHPWTKAELKWESGLIEAVCERGNLMNAYQRVVWNKGAAGVDGIGVSEFKDQLKQHWPTIKAKLLAGEYIPQPVRRRRKLGSKGWACLPSLRYAGSPHELP